jgi:NADH:ubiquinone oxidoreductase subunit F (NADH-binding)
LPADTCGVRETSNILAYLAAESARQCGPCMFGLPAIATDFAELARGRARRGPWNG